MKFVLIFGPQAVGKMTVGFELEKLTDVRLYHNHESIETIIKFFEYGSPEFNGLIDVYRMELFRAVAASKGHPGMIFTYVWPFGKGPDAHIEEIIGIFEEAGADIYFVELFAPLDVRLERNRHELRLQEKATKRDVEASEMRLRDSFRKHRLSTEEGEFTRPNYLRINNTDISAEDVAKQIKERFNL